MILIKLTKYWSSKYDLNTFGTIFPANNTRETYFTKRMSYLYSSANLHLANPKIGAHLCFFWGKIKVYLIINNKQLPAIWRKERRESTAPRIAPSRRKHVKSLNRASTQTWRLNLSTLDNCHQICACWSVHKLDRPLQQTLQFLWVKTTSSGDVWAKIY